MTLHIDHHDRVIVLTIDRPDRRNAVDHTVLCELLDAQEQIRSGAPDEVRAVVLTGSPPQSFFHRHAIMMVPMNSVESTTPGMIPAR